MAHSRATSRTRAGSLARHLSLSDVHQAGKAHVSRFRYAVAVVVVRLGIHDVNLHHRAIISGALGSTEFAAWHFKVRLRGRVSRSLLMILVCVRNMRNSSAPRSVCERLAGDGRASVTTTPRWASYDRRWKCSAHLPCHVVVAEYLSWGRIHPLHLLRLRHVARDGLVDPDVRHVLECARRHWLPLGVVLARPLARCRPQVEFLPSE